VYLVLTRDGRDVKLTTHIHLVPMLRISGNTPLKDNSYRYTGLERPLELPVRPLQLPSTDKPGTHLYQRLHGAGRSLRYKQCR